MIDFNSKKIILKLIEKSITKEELIKTLNITKRQLSYSIQKIDAYLIQHNQTPILIENRCVQLTKNSKKFLVDRLINEKMAENYVFSSNERQIYIFLMTFYYVDEYLSAQHFLYALNISKTTFSKDVKKLEKNLKPENITLTYSRKCGYLLEGDELSIRHFFKRTSEGLF